MEATGILVMLWWSRMILTIAVRPRISFPIIFKLINQIMPNSEFCSRDLTTKKKYNSFVNKLCVLFNIWWKYLDFWKTFNLNANKNGLFLSDIVKADEWRKPSKYSLLYFNASIPFGIDLKSKWKDLQAGHFTDPETGKRIGEWNGQTMVQYTLFMLDVCHMFHDFCTVIWRKKHDIPG